MSMDRKEFIQLLSVGGAAITLPSFFQNLARHSKGSSRPNIIWLNSEDGSPDIGCYGNSLVHTPNLDRLARQGARYNHSYAPCPVCSPARSGYITGMYPTSIGAQNHRSHRRDGYQLKPPVKPVTEYFMQAGYFCTNGAFGHPNRRGKTDYNFSYDFNKIYNGTDWRDHKPGQPFFAQIHFDETHRPYARQDKYKLDMNHPIDPDNVNLPPYLADHPLLRQDWALYLESWEALDRKVGTVLEELEEAGLAENTVVFYTSDGGRSNYRCKDWLYDGGIHMPLLVRWPGHIKAGTVVDRLVSGIDLSATWLDVAGITPPGYLQGQSFLDSNIPPREYIFASRDRYDGVVDRIRCVRSHRFKYIRNFYPERPYVQGDLYKIYRVPAVTVMPYLQKRGELNAVQEHFLAQTRPPEELYDVREDSDEVHNLAGDANYKKTLLSFRHKLDEWICETNDHGQVPEDPAIPAYYQKKMHQRYGQRLKKRGFPLNYFTNPEDYLTINPEVYTDYVKWWEDRDRRLTI